MKSTNPLSESLYQAILCLKTLEEAKRFFRDLLTEEEIEEFAKRWQVAQMLDQDIPYTKIQKQTGLSSTTVARISRWLRSGMGGYRLVLDRGTVSAMHHSTSSREKRLA